MTCLKQGCTDFKQFCEYRTGPYCPNDPDPNSAENKRTTWDVEATYSFQVTTNSHDFDEAKRIAKALVPRGHKVGFIIEYMGELQSSTDTPTEG